MTRTITFLAMLGTMAFIPAAHALVTGPSTVALSGTPSPTGGNYASFSTPVLNAAGQVAFRATLSSSPSLGIFAGEVGSLQTVAVRGGLAPGGGTYTDLNSPFAMNSLGQVAYYASANSTSSIFAGAPGSVQLVARQLGAAPGGGSYSNLNGVGRSPVLNNAGQIAFYATLSGSSAGEGVFMGLPGAIQPVARAGDPTSLGGIFGGFLSPVLNGAGQMALIASVSNGGSSVPGVFFGASGSLQPVALTGMAAPAGGNYKSFASFPGINSAGQVVFLSFVDGGPFLEGIFAGGLGAVQLVALKGAPAPSGGNYDTLHTPLINSSGMVTFVSSLNGGSSSLGLFEGSPGAIQTVALAGDSAPGGAVFGDFNIVAEAINGPGQLAFLASLSGPGVDTTNDMGLYAGMPGHLSKIVREGEMIDVDPSAGVDNRTITSIGFLGGSGGQDGHGPYLNDAGLLVYQLSFTDGSSGIFTSQIVAVPEPAALLQLAVIALALFSGKRMTQFKA
jgi:hypothetical protein